MATKKVNFFSKVARFFSFIVKFIKLFIEKSKEPDKQRHYYWSMAFLYYFGTMNFMYSTVVDGVVVPFISEWVLYVLAIGAFKELFIDFLLGTIFKLRNKLPFIGFADWWDFLFDWWGIMSGLVFLWIGEFFITLIF